MPGKPAFLVTIDTEGDRLWYAPREIETENARYLPRFQALCDRFGFKPTYVTNFEMAMDDGFVDWAREAQDQGRAEIGMHLHAWNCPPIRPLTRDDFHFQPYLTEYSEAVMREKVTVMTDLLEQRFERRPTSHRGGRWGFDGRYAKILVDHGYTVDCSVVPRVSFANMRGDPAGRGGPDYRGFPDRAYRLDPNDIRRERVGGLLELPVTTKCRRPLAERLGRFDGAVGWVGKTFQRLVWLRPNGVNLGDMLWLVDDACAEKRPYIQCMLHSSELMPGGSPTFPTERSVEALYGDIEALFSRVARDYEGETVSGYQRKLTG